MYRAVSIHVVLDIFIYYVYSYLLFALPFCICVVVNIQSSKYKHVYTTVLATYLSYNSGCFIYVLSFFTTMVLHWPHIYYYGTTLATFLLLWYYMGHIFEPPYWLFL